MRRQRQLGRIRRGAERARRSLAHELRKRDPRALDRAFVHCQPVHRLLDRGAGGEGLRRPESPAGDRGGRRLRLELGLAHEGDESGVLLVRVVEIEPGGRHVAADLEPAGGEPGRFEPLFSLCASAQRAALAGVRKALFDADPLHRHRILVGAPGLGAADRQVLDAEHELGIRQLGGARCELAGGVDARRLRGDPGRARFGDPDRFDERERTGLRERRR